MLREKGRHQARQAARERQQTKAFKQIYRKQSGIEGMLSQAVRRSGLRNCRYIGQAKTQLQNNAIVVATNIKRLIDGLNDVPLVPTRRARFTVLIVAA